jgi:hypothetical protein
LSRTYEPVEQRRGVRATLALIAGLVVLSLAALWLLPGSSEGALGGESAERGVSGGGGGTADEPSEDASGEPAPASVDFLCSDNSAMYWDSVRLPAEDKDRAQAAVEKFVLAAYGDPGADARAYEARVEPLVLGCFWESYAGGYAEEVEEFARAGGREGAEPSSATAPSVGYAADLVQFEVKDVRQKVYEGGVRYLTMQGNAVWVVEEQDGEFGGREQKLELARKADDDEGWKVMGGSPMPPGYSTETRREVEERIEELQYGG